MSYINKVTTDATTHLIEPTLYAVTDGTSAAYTATIANFELADGVAINLKINLTNASSPTLNINDTEVKSIYYRGSALSSGFLQANCIYTLVYNGTLWEVMGEKVDTTTLGLNDLYLTKGFPQASPTLTINSSSDGIYPCIYFGLFGDYVGDFIKLQAEGPKISPIPLDPDGTPPPPPPDPTSQFRICQYSWNSSTDMTSSYYDSFSLPITDSNKTSSNNYSILTTKSAVTIAQGGTGASTATSARTNLGLGTTNSPRFRGLILLNPSEDASILLRYSTTLSGHVLLSANERCLLLDVENSDNTNYRGIKLNTSGTINNALTLEDSTNTYKIYHSGNISDLVNDLTPYFLSANGVSF